MVRLSLSIALTACLLVIAAPLAQAELEELDRPAPFFTMPDLLSERSVGVELFMGEVDFVNVEASILALEIAGQFAVTPEITVFARLPVTRATINGVGETTMGNLTGGARFITYMGENVIGGGMSLSLPTSEQDGTGGFASYLAGAIRGNVIHRYAPDMTALRLHGDLRRELGQVFLQGQLGLDLLFIDHGDDDYLHNLLRLAGGVGYQASERLSFLGELTIRGDIFEDVYFEEDESFLSWLELGMRYQVGTILLGTRLFLPLDVTLRRHLGIIGVGFDVSLAM